MQWANLRMMSWDMSYQPLCHILFCNYGGFRHNNLFHPHKTKKGRLILTTENWLASWSLQEDVAPDQGEVNVFEGCILDCFVNT